MQPTRRSIAVAREVLLDADDDDDVLSELQAAAGGRAANVNVDWNGAVLPLMTAFVLAQFITLAMMGILYFNFILFGDYFWTILWAVLISEALQSAKGVILEGLLEVSCPDRRPGTSLIVAAAQVIGEGLRAQPYKPPLNEHNNGSSNMSNDNGLSPRLSPRLSNLHYAFNGNAISSTGLSSNSAFSPGRRSRNISPIRSAGMRNNTNIMNESFTNTASTQSLNHLINGKLSNNINSNSTNSSTTRLNELGTNAVNSSTNTNTSGVNALNGTNVSVSLISQGATALGARALLGLAVFSIASFVILMSHLMPWWLLLSGIITVLAPMLLIIWLLDRRIFIYRKVVSDNTLATLTVIGVFFLCSTFIVLFLGTESVLEGLTVAQRASKWVTSVLDNNEVKDALAQHIVKGEHILRDTLESMEATYNTTLWWKPASDAVYNYMEHGSVLARTTAGTVTRLATDIAADIAANVTSSATSSSTSAVTPVHLGYSDSAATCPNTYRHAYSCSLSDNSDIIDNNASGNSGSNNDIAGAVQSVFGTIGLEHISPSQLFHMLKAQLESWDIGIGDVLLAIGHARTGGQKMANISIKVMQGLLVVLAFLLSFGFKTFLFFTVLWYVLSQESLIERMVRDLLPISPDKKTDAVRTLRQSIEGVFFCIPTIACFHGIITLASFTVLSIEFPFFSTFLSVIFSLLPVVDPYLVCLPWVISCVMGGEWAKGIALFMLQYIVSSVVAKRIINTGVSGFNGFLTYLTVLSIFLGYSVFGVQGVFAGPLVLVLGTLVFQSLDSLANSSEQNSWPEFIMRTTRVRGRHLLRTRSMGDTNDT